MSDTQKEKIAGEYLSPAIFYTESKKLLSGIDGFLAEFLEFFGYFQRNLTGTCSSGFIAFSYMSLRIFYEVIDVLFDLIE